jgi:hypothetical protein
LNPINVTYAAVLTTGSDLATKLRLTELRECIAYENGTTQHVDRRTFFTQPDVIRNACDQYGRAQVRGTGRIFWTGNAASS